MVGAGFGGLAALRTLRTAGVETLLIDQHNYHLFTPLLYQVASALLNPSEVAHPVRAILRPLKNADFRLARVERVDCEHRRLHTSAGYIAYDYLVLAAGSLNNYFGNRSLAVRSFALKSLEEALTLRNRLLTHFEHAAAEPDPRARRQHLTFAIVGGGPTGVEYAGALSELVALVLKKDFPRLDTREVEILLIEAADRILAAFTPGLQQSALRTLHRKGIKILLNAPVRELRDGVLELADGRELKTAMVVFTAGVRGSTLGETLAGPLGPAGRVKVEPTLQLKDHPEVFVIGDMAAIFESGHPLPMLAPVAIQTGRWAARNIQRMLAGQEAQPFRYRDKGTMATIGRNAAVVQIGRLHLAGFLGWVTWLLVHLVMIVGFRNRLVVLVNWAWEYFRRDRPVRLITQPADWPERRPRGS